MGNRRLVLLADLQAEKEDLQEVRKYGYGFAMCASGQVLRCAGIPKMKNRFSQVVVGLTLPLYA